MRSLLRLAALGPAILLGAGLAAAPASATTAHDHQVAAPAVRQAPPGDLRDWPEPPIYNTSNRALVLTMTEGHRNSPYDRQAFLVCSPVQSTGHPYAWSACSQLDQADGDFDDLRTAAPWFACTRDFEPVTVTASGMWDGRYVRFQRTFANACQLRYSTGSIFRF